MSATLLQLPQRPAPKDATLHDLRFRALLGSDAERVLRQATVPVLLIRERPAKS